MACFMWLENQPGPERDGRVMLPEKNMQNKEIQYIILNHTMIIYLHNYRVNSSLLKESSIVFLDSEVFYFYMHRSYKFIIHHNASNIAPDDQTTQQINRVYT